MSIHFKMSNPVKVVAAVFKRENTFLACRRKAGLSNGLQWEFPGGKQKPDEASVDALIREIDEELGVLISVGESLGTHVHLYADKAIELQCFLVRDWTGEFSPIDHDKIEWFKLEDLASIELSAADVPFVERISIAVQG